MDRPVIVCGFGRVGRRVLEYLRAAHLPAVLIDQNFHPSHVPPDSRTVTGDCRNRETLIAADIAAARGVIVCTSDDLVNLSTVLVARSLNAEVRIVVRMFNQNLVPRLGRTVHNVFALSVSALGAPVLALTAITGELLSAFSLHDGPRQIAAVPVTSDSEWNRLTVGEAANRSHLIPLARLPRTGDEQHLRDLSPNQRLASGDRLIVCGSPKNVQRAVGHHDELGLLGVRWAGKLRRFGRVFHRTFLDVDLAVKVCTAILVGVLVFSTCVYHWGVGDSWPAALYHTVSVIATGADLRAEQLPAAYKVFVSGLRIAGAAMLAAFTAIFTQFLLRARLGGAFEQRRIPDGGHVVVCGLGNIGFRVVEELLKAGEEVVAIEPARDARFLASARRMGAAVITADATVLDVLTQARVGTAKAVVASTGNELANVEIALMARDLNPMQRVVVRISDPQLADALRDAANVRLALSVPALAAPAFVAALFGDRVLSAVRIGSRLVLVVELAVPAGDVCLEGRIVREVAEEFQLLPIAVFDCNRKPDPIAHEHRLMAGEHLVAVAGLSELERLFSRQRATANEETPGGSPGAK
jgi:Trk K+ transport system NAD-binding subunit